MGIKTNHGLLFVCMVAFVMLTGCKSSDPDDALGNADIINDNEPVVNAHEERVQVQPRPKPKPHQPQIRPESGIIIFDSDGTDEILLGKFYFDFDQTIVKRRGHAELNKHAQVLREYRNYRIRLDGHTDERGTREYNLALGERRANAICSYLVAQGVFRSQIEIVSYGEEKPIARGHEESSWVQNRRVEIKYKYHH